MHVIVADNLPLLLLKLPKVMMPAQSPDPQNLLELGEVPEDSVQVLVLEAVDHQAVCARLLRFVAVLVEYSENEASVSDVTASVELEQFMAPFSVSYFNLTLLYKVDT